MTLQRLKMGATQFELFEKGNKVGGLELKSLKFDRRFTFLDYVFGGCEISLSIAIDFTLSNGDPRDPKSLHYFDPSKNEYI